MKWRNAWRSLTAKPPKRRVRMFAAAESNRLTEDWAVVSTLSPNDELRWSIAKVRARARDLEHNNALVKSYFRLLMVSVIGAEGMDLEVDALTLRDRPNERVSDLIEDGWDDWSRCVSIDGRYSRPSFERMLIRTVARDGEAFVRKWRGFEGNAYGLGLECIDAAMVDETLNISPGENRNEVRMGVEINRYAAPVAYWLWDKPLSLTGSNNRKRIRVPADEIVHLFDPDRCQQSRGVSWLAPAMVPLKHLDAYFEAELVATRLSAAKMMFFQRKDMGFGVGALPETKEGEGGQPEFEVDVQPGSSTILPDGYEIAEWNPNHPNSAFSEFLKGATRRIAAALGVSYASLAADMADANYSSMRAGMLLEHDVWRCMQEWWVSSYMTPIYREWLNSAILHGAIALPGSDYRRFTNVKWTPRGYDWVDPLKDTQASILAVQAGFTSRQEILSEQGRDVEDVFEQLAKEEALAKELGITLAAPPAPAGDTTQSEDDTVPPKKNGSTKGLVNLLKRF